MGRKAAGAGRLLGFEKRYDVLMRLLRSLASTHLEELVLKITAGLAPVLKFDLLGIIFKSNSAGWEMAGGLASGSPSHTLPAELKTRHSVPLIGRGSEPGSLVVGRFDEIEFSEVERTFLNQVADQGASPVAEML